MGLRCKVGDMAIAIIAHKYWSMFIFEVVAPAPVGVAFRLPDGYLHQAVPSGHWVLKSVIPVKTMRSDGSTITSQYGVGPDAILKPIRPPSPPESVDTPENVEAVA